MALFKRKSQASTRSKVELLSNEDGSLQLAFGLNWSSIVSTGGKEAAVKLAKQRGASHFIFRGQQVGFGSIDTPKSTLQLTRIVSAAHVAARQHGGDAIHAYKISDGEYWLASIRNSQPTSIDRFIHADNDSILADEVMQLLQAAKDDGVAFQVFTNLNVHDFGSVTRSGPEDLMMAVGHDIEKLEQIQRASANIPKPILIATGIAVAVALGQAGYKHYKGKQAEKARLENLPVENEPAPVAWARAVKQWEATMAGPRSDGFKLARESLGQAPATWNGWLLKAANCAASPVQFAGATAPTSPASAPRPINGASRTWSCEAQYERNKDGALNRDMALNIPSNWAVTFQPLNRMKGAWTVVEAVAPMKIAELKPVSFHLVDTVSKFQALAPIFAQDISMNFAAIKIPAPKKSDGTAFPVDTSAISVMSAPISIKAPLRSIDMVMVSDIPADWTRIAIAITASDSKKFNSTISQSPISAEVSGVIYAKNN